MGDFTSNDEDVPFDYGVADSLITKCDSAATLLDGQAGARSSWTRTALADFRGRFSELFENNQSVGAADAQELANRLREVARCAEGLKEAAFREQQRRETARQWQRERDHRNAAQRVGDTVHDWVFGEDDPPKGPPDEPRPLEVSASISGSRDTPAPGTGGGGGGGTSAARPSDLRTFATNSAGANDAVRGWPGALRSAYADFQAKCRWGRISCEAVINGFDRWLALNDEDVHWAKLVADAFARAGGDGSVSRVADSALLAALRAGGVDATRDDIVIDPPLVFGSPPTSGYADDPVNAATGNFVENEVDLGFAGGCASLALTRTYNSFDAGAGAFGPGWSSWTEAGLEFGDDSARMRMADGRVIVFPRLSAAWDRATGASLWLDRLDEGYLVTGNDGALWTFAADGELHEHSRGAGTAVRLIHAQGQLVRLEHERGRSIDLAWDGDRVVEAVASDGRRAAYVYDDAGRLVTATTALGSRSYEWNDNGLIRAVVDADGVVEAKNTYDARGRVTHQLSQYGRTSRFVYLPGNVTVVSDEDGTRSNTWISDARGRVIGIVDAHEQRQSTSYDSYGNPVLVTERDGAATVHEYDDRGRRVRTVTPSGADLTYGYDDADRVTTVVTESGAVTVFEYAGEDRNPSVVVDPEGGRTQMSWEGGLLTRVIDPTGVFLTFDYDEHGDLVATTDALGNTARLVRDEMGRVTAAITPSGNRTTYAYSSPGLLASRRDPDGAVWRYEHTTAGRMTAVVDPTGARTEVEYGTHGEEARTIDPLGRAIVRHLDDLGNVAAAELPDGSTWRFSHDGLSRLVATTDPTGAVWTNEFDETGDLAGTVDPTGVRCSISSDRARGSVTVDDTSATVSTRFDPLGRVTASEQPDGSAAMASYDRCGRPVELLDAEGGLTRISRDPAGRPVEVASPTGAVTRYSYDVCGRLAAVTDPTGAATTREYDTDGRVVRQILPTGEVARTEYDPCGRVTEHQQPGRGVARYAYDPAGRLKESSDTWYGHRKYRYDSAGQLVEAVNGNGGVTRYDYDANGRAVAITDPLGNVTRRDFDAMNRCVAETDPLGRTTRAGYDAAGRQVWQEDPEGHRTEWAYDDAGRVATTLVDGRVVTAIARDIRNRRVTITDNTDNTAPAGRASIHELEWNRRGQLVRRARDDQEVSWTYDADGARTGMITPDGHTTSYGHDAAGRLITVEHPLLGRVVLERDAAGLVVQAAAGDTIQTWDHQNGWVIAHTISDPEGSARTTIDRDQDGRVVRIDRDGVSTGYDYDQACQLTEARTGGSVSRWAYDVAGRLVTETTDGATRAHTYGAAGQLASTRTADGNTTRHTYDALGRRIRTEHADGRVRELTWSAIGWLSAITDHAADQVRRTRLHVDGTGELATIDDTPVFWDTADPYAPALIQAGDTPVVPAGPVTGVGTSWPTPGWRTARTDTSDPWNTNASTASVPGLPDGISIGGAGELTLGATDPLEWLGARVYDPINRGFLTVDPLDATPGSGWSGNPYSYAGNDPLHALDPTGLKPLTDADLNAYVDSRQGALHAAGSWISDHREYVAAAAMVAGGFALMFVPIPGAQLVGAGLMSAGIDTAIQQAASGEVNWGQVAVSGVAGTVGFGTGAALSKLGVSGLRAAAAAGALEGGLGGGGAYLAGPGPHTVDGLLSYTAAGTFFGGTGGAAGHGLTTVATRKLAEVNPRPFMPASVGPLSDDLAATFVGGRYTTSVTTADQLLYRAGDQGRPLGQFFSSEPPVGVTQTRIDKAIPVKWPDGRPAPISTGYAINIPAGTTIHTGEVANQGGIYMGGTEQVVVQRPWEIPGVEVVRSWPLQ